MTHEETSNLILDNMLVQEGYTLANVAREFAEADDKTRSTALLSIIDRIVGYREIYAERAGKTAVAELAAKIREIITSDELCANAMVAEIGGIVAQYIDMEG